MKPDSDMVIGLQLVLDLLTLVIKCSAIYTNITYGFCVNLLIIFYFIEIYYLLYSWYYYIPGAGWAGLWQVLFHQLLPGNNTIVL